MEIQKFWDLPIILVVCVLIFKFWFLKSLRRLMQVIRLRESGIKSKGRVKSFLVSTNEDGIQTYRSVIEYRTPEGQNSEFDDRFSHKQKPIIGKEVDILYDISDSKNIIVDSQGNYESQVMLFCIASFIMAIVLFFAIVTIKEYL